MNNPYPHVAKISLPELETKVREIVAEDPDFVYQMPESDGGGGKCVYVDNGEPSCLFGRAFVELGVPLDEVARMDQDNHGIKTVLEKAHGVDYTLVGPKEDAPERIKRAHWMSEMQNWQDDEEPYGRVLDIADSRIDPYNEEDED